MVYISALSGNFFTLLMRNSVPYVSAQSSWVVSVALFCCLSHSERIIKSLHCEKLESLVCNVWPSDGGSACSSLSRTSEFSCFPQYSDKFAYVTCTFASANRINVYLEFPFCYLIYAVFNAVLTSILSFFFSKKQHAPRTCICILYMLVWCLVCIRTFDCCLLMLNLFARMPKFFFFLFFVRKRKCNFQIKKNRGKSWSKRTSSHKILRWMRFRQWSEKFLFSFSLIFSRHCKRL